MSNFILLSKIISIVAVLCCANIAFAQTANSIEKKITVPANAIGETKKAIETNDGTDKKMLSNATINLQTTVTGNQEQPRVLYILPWQSPATDAVDFETFDSQQKAVFGHVERDELRRELESSTE